MRAFDNSPEPADFGLVAWREAARVALPLKGVECRFEVTGAVVNVELDQVYHHDGAAVLECTYRFPLPRGATVYRCEMLVGERTVWARAESKWTAREAYASLTREDRSEPLAEPEPEPGFVLALGPVQPGELVVVRLAYFHVLDRRAELGQGGLQWRLPMGAGGRFLPGKPLLRSSRGRGTADDSLPEALRILPPPLEELHPEAAYFALAGRFSPGAIMPGSISSSTHAVRVQETPDAVSVELADADGAAAAGDFVLAWREPAATTLVPQAWRWEGYDATYALVQWRAPQDPGAVAEVSQDFYFLVDRSDSMRGRKWEQAWRAFRGMVEQLGPNDRVWLTVFHWEISDFSTRLLSVAELRADPAFLRLEEYGTVNITDTRDALEHIMEKAQRHSVDGTGRPAVVVLITDSFMDSEWYILQTLYDAPLVRLHALVIDTATPDPSLRALARQAHGECWSHAPEEEIDATAALLGRRLRQPVLRDLTVSEGWQTANGLPDLHAGEVMTAVFRGENAAPLELRGRSPDGRELRFSIPEMQVGTRACELLWVCERMARLRVYAQYEDAGDLAEVNNVVGPHMVFTAWDEAGKTLVATDDVVRTALREPDPASPEGMRRMFADRHPGETHIPHLSMDDSDDSDTLYAWRDRVRAEAGLEPARVHEGRELGRDGGTRMWEDRIVPMLSHVGFQPEQLEALKERMSEEVERGAQRHTTLTPTRAHAIRQEAERLDEAFQKLDRPETREAVRGFLGSFESSYDGRMSTPDLGILAMNVHCYVSTRDEIIEQGAPREVADAILHWILGDTHRKSTRWSNTLRFLEALKAETEAWKAEAARLAAWQRMLDYSLGRESAAYAAAWAWLPELEPPGSVAVKSPSPSSSSSPSFREGEGEAEDEGDSWRATDE